MHGALRAACHSRAAMDSFDVATEGLAIMEAVRPTNQTLSEFVDGHGVGGLAQLTILTSTLWGSRVVHVSPDNVGERSTAAALADCPQKTVAKVKGTS